MGGDGKAGAYVWDTYAAAGAKVDKLAACLTVLGVAPENTVGIYGANSPEWMLSMQACIAKRAIIVPLYESLGHNAVEYQLSHANCVAALVQASKLPNLASALQVPRAAGQWGGRGGTCRPV